MAGRRSRDVVLVGHSSGTQVAARVAGRWPPSVRALVLASPTMDPRFPSQRRIMLAWRRNHELEPKNSDEQHAPERQRTALRRMRHALKVHLADALENVVPEIHVPVLVLYGDQDRICTHPWARELSELAPTDGSAPCLARTASSGRRVRLVRAHRVARREVA